MAKKLSVIERRLQGPSALMTESLPIPMKEKGWVLRWENAEISGNHIWNVINQLGWEYALADDLDCGLEDIGARALDGKVVRGERGKEILVKMKVEHYRKVQGMKTRENIANTFDTKKVRSAVLNAVGSAHGDEAASFVHKANITVNDSRERVSLDE